MKMIIRDVAFATLIVALAVMIMAVAARASDDPLVGALVYYVPPSPPTEFGMTEYPAICVQRVPPPPSPPSGATTPFCTLLVMPPMNIYGAPNVGQGTGAGTWHFPGSTP